MSCCALVVPPPIAPPRNPPTASISSMQLSIHGAVFLGLFRNSRAHGRATHYRRTSQRKSRTREVKERHTRLTAQRACQQCLPGTREGPSTGTFGSCRPIRPEFFAGCAGIQRFSSTLFFASSMPPRRQRSRGMLFGQHLGLTYQAQSPQLCRRPCMRFMEIDPYTQSAKVGAANQECPRIPTVGWARRTGMSLTSAGW